MVHHVRDLSVDQRLAIESLLGRPLREEESVTVRPSLILKEAPVGEERVRAAQKLKGHLDLLAARVKDVPEDEIERAVDEAIENIRHKAE
jgi:hypothetical protein